MKSGWSFLLLLLACLSVASVAEGQISLYAEGGADYLNGGPYTNFLYGGIAGIVADGPVFMKGRMVISADLQSAVGYNNAGGASTLLANNERYVSFTIGPRITLLSHFLRLSPYIQANIGFARYQDPQVHSSTDSVLGGQAGVTRRLTPRFDAVFDYSYSTFGYNFTQYNPQMFSAGAVFHFVKR